MGSDALRSAHGGNVVIEIERAMEMLRDQSENTEEISDALQDGTQVAVDAESVLDEWIQESATQQAVPSVPHPVPVLHDLPAVPSGRPRSPPQAPAVAISDADRSRELQSAVWTQSGRHCTRRTFRCSHSLVRAAFASCNKRPVLLHLGHRKPPHCCGSTWLITSCMYAHGLLLFDWYNVFDVGHQRNGTRAGVHVNG